LREPTSRRKLLAVVAILIVATAIGGALAWFVGRDTSNPVPVLIGLHEGEALNMVSEFGWNVVTEREASDDVAAGLVIRTDPVAGASLDQGHDFTLTVSTGPAPRVLPELTGLTVDEATAALVALNLDLQLRDQPFSETVPVGTIVAWAVPDQPSLVAGDTVLPGTNIVVSVSAGPEPRVLPDLTGFSLVDATAQLQALGLTVAQAPDEFSDQAIGAVARQDPPVGTSVPRDSAVTIVLSKGPDLVAIPALANFNLQQATDALTAAGLTVGAVKGDPAGIVVLAEANGVALAADTQLVRGTPVDLTLQVPAPPAPPAP
jgi:serine/threonine-protein kinase